mgnify:CR=1 FL=1
MLPKSLTPKSPSQIQLVMDTIFIESLRVDALVGVYAYEREAVQPLLFDIRLGYDNRVPAASDEGLKTVVVVQQSRGGRVLAVAEPKA